MRKILLVTALTLPLTLAMTTNVFAAGDHDDDHGDGHGEMAVGEPGKKKRATKTVRVKMLETDDGDMIFKPNRIKITQGQTVRFQITNAGELEHEFVLDEHDAIIEHKEVMAKFPEMEHDDPNSVRLEPGEKSEIIWKFTNGGHFEFACLIPGHYEAGMMGKIDVKHGH